MSHLQKSVNICCLADTHGYHRFVQIPEGCDILVVAGDFSRRGERETILDLSKWFDELKSDKIVGHIIVIAGNHELSFDPKKPEYNAQTKNILAKSANSIFLEESGCEVMGLKFWGSAATPYFCDWAQNYARGDEIDQVWSQIDLATEILITHGPCYGIGDYIPEEIEPSVGCEMLRQRIATLKNLKLHVFGHIHDAYGVYDIEGNKFPLDYIPKNQAKTMSKIFINASICDEGYNPVNSPIVVEI